MCLRQPHRARPPSCGRSWTRRGAPETGSDGLIEYDFSKSPTLKVPGDWNTQHDSLFYYEGLLWYQRDFTYQPIANHKTFLHIGAANYNCAVLHPAKVAFQ